VNTDSALHDLGLGGDGDEIEAIRAVEIKFDVRFDQSDADGWHTVGDVFASLLRRLEQHSGEEHLLWADFRQLLGEGAGLYPDEIERMVPETDLLAPAVDLRDSLHQLWKLITGQLSGRAKPL
jgi:hypothetical protein